MLHNIQSVSIVEQAMQMAMQTSSAYCKMQEVFRRYEECDLKGQKPRKMTNTNVQKALQGKFAAKLHHFKIFQGLMVNGM